MNHCTLSIKKGRRALRDMCTLGLVTRWPVGFNLAPINCLIMRSISKVANWFQVIFSKFPTSFQKLIILLTPKCKELSYKKLDNNDA